MAEYAVASALACVIVVALELAVFHTGIFRRGAYWIAMGISYFFMVWVNGWLTKLSAPIVLYDPDMKTPWRFPWDIPVEDYLFGFAMLTLAMVLWERAGRAADASDDERADGSAGMDDDRAGRRA